MNLVYFFLVVLIVLFIFAAIKAFLYLREERGVKQFVEVLENDRYKIITEVWLKGDLIKKFSKVTKGDDAEKVADSERTKGINHYKIIKRFSR